MEASNFKKKTISSIYWNTVIQVGGQVVTIAISLFLFRLLTPSDYSLIGMALVFSGFSNILLNFGFSSALIQKKKIDDVLINSIFWINIFMGGAICLILILFASPIANFFGYSELFWIVILLSLTYIINSFSIVQEALFTKALKFKELAIRKIIALVLSGIIAIVLAFSGFGVWSLVIQQIALSIFNAILIWFMSDWRPRFIYSHESIKAVFGFSSSLFFNSTLNYLAENLDNLIVGKYMDTPDLGLYSKSFQMVSIPPNNISRILSKVMFPSFSLIQDDKNKVRDIYLKMNRVVAFISFPLMLAICFSAESFVLTVFGQKWIDAVPFVRVFCISGIIMSINVLLGSLIISQGRSDLIMKDAIYKKSLIISGISIGAFFGLLGIALGRMIADILTVFITFYHAKKAIQLSIWNQIKILIDVLFYSLICSLAAYFIISFFDLHFILEFSLMMLLTATFYLAISYIVKLDALNLLLDNLRYSVKT